MGFDIDSCCVAYDGSKVYALPRAIRSMRHRLNCCDLSRRSLTYEYRLLKYSDRGFAIGVMGLDMTLVDEERFKRPHHSYTGLSRLLASNQESRCSTHEALLHRAYSQQMLEADPNQTSDEKKEASTGGSG
jgi:hypothetical protein